MFIFSLIILIAELIALTSPQRCGPKSPETPESCFADTSKLNTCCYIGMSKGNLTASTCVYIPHDYTFFAPLIEQLEISLGHPIETSIDCNDGKDKNKNFDFCGVNPESVSDCTKNSSEDATCCYYENHHKRACIMNHGKLKDELSMFGVKISCEVALYKINYIIIMTLVLLIVT